MKPLPILLLLAAGMASAPVSAMGLRAFVALPLEKDGVVWRPLLERNNDSDVSQLTNEFAYGLSATQTLMLALPYRVEGGDGRRTGDLMMFYRHQMWADDTAAGTTRWSLLGGAVMDDDGRLRPQLGTVATWFHDRHEIDADVIGVAREDETPASARYDLSWQYRLNTCACAWWLSVLELGGRWRDGAGTTQQLTLGLQRIEGPLVVEGGVVRDLNKDHDTTLLLGARFHF